MLVYIDVGTMDGASQAGEGVSSQPIILIVRGNESQGIWRLTVRVQTRCLERHRSVFDATHFALPVHAAGMGAPAAGRQ